CRTVRRTVRVGHRTTKRAATIPQRRRRDKTGRVRRVGNVGAVTLPPKGRAQVMRELDSEGRGAAFHYGHIRRLDRDDRRAQSVGDQVTSRDRRTTIRGRRTTRFPPRPPATVTTT